MLKCIRESSDSLPQPNSNRRRIEQPLVMIIGVSPNLKEERKHKLRRVDLVHRRNTKEILKVIASGITGMASAVCRIVLFVMTISFLRMNGSKPRRKEKEKEKEKEKVKVKVKKRAKAKAKRIKAIKANPKEKGEAVTLVVEVDPLLLRVEEVRINAEEPPRQEGRTSTHVNCF